MSENINNETQLNIEDPFMHEVDLVKLPSDLIRERYEEAIERATENGLGNLCPGEDESKADTFIEFMDSFEKAMIGTMVNQYGNVVPVYEHQLCIDVLAHSYTDKDLLAMAVKQEEIDNQETRMEKCYEIATDAFENDTIARWLPYQGEHAPVIIDGFMCDSFHEFFPQK